MPLRRHRSSGSKPGSKSTTEDITKTNSTTDTTLVERKTNLLPPYNDADFEDVDIEKGSMHESEFGENRLSTHSNTTPAIPAYTPPKPSIQLLFSFISRRDAFVVLLPSCFVSIIAGGVAPFMTHVLGQGFDAFSVFATSTASTPPNNDEKNKLLHDVGIASLELLALAAGAVALSCLMSSLWILVGERNVLGLRRWAYDGVVSKELEWFDLNMRANLEDGKVDEKGAETAEDKPTTSGAAGMMAKFAKETDEVRMASSLPLGIILQNLTTVLACLALAFRGSWSLTLIIFSTIPLMIFIQSLTAKNVGPYLNMDRNILSQCADHCERGFGTIGTVKGFNAEDRELDQLEYFLDHLTDALRGLYKTYAISNGTSQFISMTTFVTGFWFGAHLVRSGQASAGGVMSVFWACLIAVNNLQLAVPHLATLGKGIGAMIALRMAVETPIPPRAEMEPPIMDDTDGKLDIPRPSKMIPLPNKHGYGDRMQLRKIVPSLPAKGSFVLRNITFAYPTRPLQPVLKDVSLFLPANEMTFIVGSSGSGKSTIGSLLMRLYDPQYGVIEMDDQDLSHLDPAWLRANIFPVEQKVVLFEGTVHQNVAMALEGSAYRRPGEESRAEVIAACRASLMHEFVVEELADGYDTIIGHGKGTDLLSGGQKQRLGIARARLRDPAVLILDECTSSLDPTTRSLIFSAVRLWRRNRTTIVITHDLSMIGKGDFVYVMKAGKVVEQGYRGDLEGRGEFGRMAHVGVTEKDKADMETIGEADVEDDKSRHAIDIWADNDNSLGVNGFPVAGTRSVSRQSGNVFEGWNFANAWKENNPNASSSDPNSSGETQVSSSLAVGPIAPNKRWSPLPPARPRPPSRQLLQPSPNSSEGGAYREQGRAISISIPSNAFTHENRISIHSRQPIAQPSSATSIQFHRPMAATPVVSPPLTGQPPSIPPLSHLAAQFLSQHSRPPSFAPSRRDRGSVISQTETVIGDVDGEVMVMDDYPAIVDEDDEFDEDKAALQRTALAASHHRNTFYSTSDPEMPPRKSITREMRLQSLSMQRERELSISQQGGKRPSSTSTNGTKVGKHNSGTLKKKHSKRPSEVIDAAVPAALPTMVDEKDVAEPASIQHPSEPDAPLREVLWRVYKSAPKKFLLFLGVICCLLSGAVTPVFSFILSKLLVEVSLGAHDKSVVNLYGGIILAIAFADGLFMGFKFFIMQISAVYWVQEVRKKAFMNVLKQDKKWFDRGDHGAEKLVQIMFKDGEDAQQLIGQILGQSVVVIAMLGLGLIWALVLGWQLTLAGFAIAPIFAGVMSVQATLVERFARRNKDCREEVAKGYYETISNIRSIRSMAFEGIFRTRYEKSLTAALRAGVKGAFVEGCNMGVASGLIYLAEALLFWIGAVLVAREIYSYAQMVQVLQLVVFSVSIASQLLAFTGGINKAIQATRDLDKLLTLGLETEESHGRLEPAIRGNICFKNVGFSYPERPTVPVLRGLNLNIHQGECIAIVGGSGSGKSTIVALLQRLYNPTSGKITVEGTDLGETGVAWLRDNISIVSQNPHLFDMTVIDNIAYGSRPISDEECYQAAQACNADEFILDLPDAYETQLGGNADLLSGGQAQRIAIARALVRGAKVLILDECTSALDPENQAFVMESIRKVKSGRTVIIVTHKLPVMRMCDRIVVVDNGVVAEEGTYDSLVERRGVFAQLASGGEWDP